MEEEEEESKQTIQIPSLLSIHQSDILEEDEEVEQMEASHNSQIKPSSE
jgi:hypothetical protein